MDSGKQSYDKGLGEEKNQAYDECSDIFLMIY